MTRDEALKLAAECMTELPSGIYAARPDVIWKLCQEVESRAYERAAKVCDAEAGNYRHVEPRERKQSGKLALEIRALKPKQDTQ